MIAYVFVRTTKGAPTQDMMLAQYKTDPRMHPDLVRTQEETKEKNENHAQTRQKRKIVVRTKTQVKNNVVKDVPQLIGRQEFLFGPSVTSTTTTASPTTSLSTDSSTASSSPLGWLASYFPFSGIPSNIFNLSPMSLFGDGVFGNVVLNSDMGPHFLLKK